MTEDRLLVGRIVKAHGIRGEVAVEVTSDAPDRYAPGSVLGAGDPPRTVTVEAARPHQGRLLVKFVEIPDRTAAEALHGQILSIPIEQAQALPDGAWYPHQLEGFTVVDEGGAELGVWQRAEQTPAHDVWVVRAGGRLVLVPAVRDVIKGVDMAARRIVIAPPEGLFE